MYPLLTNINTVATYNPPIDLSDDSKAILQKIKNFKPSFFFRHDAILESKLKSIQAVELTKILNRLFSDIAHGGVGGDPLKYIDKLATIIPMETLLRAVQGDVDEILQEAKCMFEEAKVYLATTRQTSPPLRAHLTTLIDGTISAISGLVSAFGIGNFFNPPRNQFDADMKSQKIMTLLMLASTLVNMIAGIGGAMGSIVSGIFLTIAALSLVWPMFKPIPSYLPAKAENWTKEVERQGFVAEGRKESLNEIANILKMDRHAILVGPSRVGKSLTAKAFAQAVANGDYPWLKGKVVFRINTTELLSSANSILADETPLQQVSTAMGRHRKDIILVLDEIHMACKNNEKVADQLKTFLDEGGEFAHVIGITTTQEYEKHVQENVAFSLRFDRVNIENTSADETLKILGDTVLTSRSKPLMAQGALQYIYEQSQKIAGAPQPATATKILKQCINLTGKTQKSQTQKKLIDLANRKSSLYSQAAANRDRTKEMKFEIIEIEKEERALQNTHKSERAEFNRLFQAKDLLDCVTQESYITALKVSTIAQAQLNGKEQLQISKHLLINNFLKNSLTDYIDEKSEALGVVSTIDCTLVDKVVQG
ncbi:MAG: AAA family ATPase [Parachlamydiaceae bacterium]